MVPVTAFIHIFIMVLFCRAGRGIPEMLMRTRRLLFLALLIVAVPSQAACKYSFSVVPQQSASKTARIWKPILTYLQQHTGCRFILRTTKSIPLFEKKLAAASHDFSYMNPYHYTVFHDMSGYQALAKARDKRIKGIVVVRKDSPVKSLKDLHGKVLAFPSPAAFAASILPRGYLASSGIAITPRYVASHDSVYRNVAKGRYPAGGGVIRTFRNASPEVRAKLRILWTTKGYTPHAIAAHKRVPVAMQKKVQAALVALETTPAGKKMLKRMKVKGFVPAKNADWDDVRALKLNELK